MASEMRADGFIDRSQAFDAIGSTRPCALPLTPLFRSWHPEPRFTAESSANWRGYQGTWEIIGTDLFLTDFSGILEQNSDPAESAAVGVLDVEFLDAASNPRDHRDKAATYWRQAVAHLDSLPKDEHGESISDQTHALFGDDTGFIQTATAETSTSMLS